MSVKVTVDRLAVVVANIKAMGEKRVMVGIPESNPERREDTKDSKVKVSGGKASGGAASDVNNATLGYIHETGSPAQGIPARPFLIPGVQSARKDVTNALKSAAKQALNGDKRAVEKGLERAGMIAQAAVREAITHGSFEPLAESTLKARARRGRKGAKAELKARAEGAEPSNALAKPLIDTGQLRNSVTYVVRKK